MNTIENDVKKIFHDATSIFYPITSLSQQQFFALSGFLGIFALSFFFDSDIRYLINNCHTEFFNQLFSFFHWYGKPYLSLLTMTVLYVGGYVFAKSYVRIVGLKIFESFAFSGIVVTILKSLFGRWRPYTEHSSMSFTFFTAGPNDHLSLPSGDVAIAFAFSTIIAGTSDNKIWKWTWYLLAVITSIGRIYHDQHWLSDVILAAGIAIGIGTFVNRRTHNDPN